MRINRYLAMHTGLSRRAADQIIATRNVQVNGSPAIPGQDIQPTDTVLVDGKAVVASTALRTILLHKPVGYVVSRNGQGSPTIYNLLPPSLHNLKPIGRLDKDSSGLLLLTNDGQLAQQLTHPRFHKIKIYDITLDTPLQPLHRQMVIDHGIVLPDGLSKLAISRLTEGDDYRWRVQMYEGRNRQIRRTFAALGYDIIRLHRIQFGTYTLDDLLPGTYKETN